MIDMMCEREIRNETPFTESMEEIIQRMKPTSNK